MTRCTPTEIVMPSEIFNFADQSRIDAFLIDVDSFFVLGYSLTKSNVHENQMFEAVWDDLPDNVIPERSLADSTYNGEKCLQACDQARGDSDARDKEEREVLQTSRDGVSEDDELREALAEQICGDVREEESC